ncbi:winged helix-turn-helix transcriptional regulator [Candidatus Pacearchaeota archaeon]|nr:winged helix-turn-helix transcriptional regulator [Candidatus Pacearchaeota archaeon]
MDFDLFLTSPRWEILQIIAEKPTSPIEIAEKLNTTVSYISQNLKLLDAANLLNREKTGAVEKGKPRTLFSLKNELFYLTLLSKNKSEKRLVSLNNHHKTILSIWSIKDPELHYYFEKFYWKIEDDLDETEGVFIETTEKFPRFLIISESKKLKTKVEAISKKFEKEIDYLFITKSQIKRINHEFLNPLYDPLDIFQELKGGLDKKDG